MGEVLGILVALLVGAAVVLAVPISLVLLWSSTRRLRERIETLEAELQQLRGVLQVREVREVRGVPEVPEVRGVRGVPEVREVRDVRGVQEVQEVEEVQEVQEVRDSVAAPAPPTAAPVSPAAPVAPVAPDAPHAPRAPRAPGAPRSPEAPPRQPESLETAIGSRWLLYIGVIAIVIGVAYFEKLAIDYGWIGETARVIQGAAVGLALMFTGTRFAKRGYAAYGQIIAGGGGAILYLSVYAAFNFYALIERPAAFTLMVAITALIAWLADRQRSQGLALFAVGGGFATPFLLPGPTDAQIALFTYGAILIGGTAALARRRDWPFLHLVSYVFTLLTVAGWADRFYAPAKYLRTELYLTLYCAMFLYILRECRRHSSDAAKVVALLLWTAPFAYYLSSLVVLAMHDSALMVWLVALMLTGGIAATRLGPVAGLVTWIAAAAPLVVWCSMPTASSMRQEGLITLAAIYVIALLAELEGTVLRDDPREPGATDIAWTHLNPLATYAGAYLLISPVSLVNAGYLAAAFGAWYVVLAAVLWRRRPGFALHFLAVAFTLAAIAIGLVFDGTAITAGWAVEGALAIALALRQRLGWLRLAGLVLFAVAVGQTLLLLATPAPASHVVLFNSRAACALLVAALAYALAWYDWRDPGIPEREAALAAALLTAQVVTLALLTSEIHAYWAIRNGHLERELMLSITWGLYATVLVVIGLARDYAPIRYFAILVLALTIGKVFFFDMSELDRIYRVGSVIALGILLLVTSYLYSRARQAD